MTGIRIPKGMDLTKTYYLAGPMSGYPDFNYPAFEKAEVVLRDLGLHIASPHRNPWPPMQPVGRRADDPPASASDDELWQAMMKSALRQLLSCQGLILLRGWTESKGAVIEANIASGLKMPMFFLDGQYLVAMSDGEST